MRTPAASLALVLLAACGSSAGPSGEGATARDGGAAETGSAASEDGGGLGSDAGPDGAGVAEAAIEAGRDAAGGTVLSAPDDTWTWVPLAGMRCGDGSPTGIGLNPHAGATHLLLYLQGGGACYDATSCWGKSPTASNMTGYGASDFAADPTTDATIFSRKNTGNPFNDATMIFVPYCTGDLHVGTGTATYTVAGQPKPTYFSGAINVDTVIASVAATYPALTHVFLTGVSAGGFGTFLNQDAVTRGLGGSVPVDVVDDSGPAVAGAVPGDWKARFPPGCASCAGAPDVFAYVRATYPASRYAFLTFQTDDVLPQFFGQTQKAFAQTIAQFVSSLASDPNAKAFVDQSTGHVVLAETDAKAAPYILPWLTQMATGDSAWANAAH